MAGWKDRHRRSRRRWRSRRPRRGQTENTRAWGQKWRTRAAERKRQLKHEAIDWELDRILTRAEADRRIAAETKRLEAEGQTPLAGTLTPEGRERQELEGALVQEQVKPGGYERIGRATAWIVAIVGGWLIGSRVFAPWVENDLGVGESIFKIGGALLPFGALAWGVYRWQERRSWRQRREWRDAKGDELTTSRREPDFRPNRGWVAPVAAFGVVAAFIGSQVGQGNHEGLIRPYCWYGAVSSAQLDSCERHVSSSYIRSLDTNAARFAKGKLNACLADSGPFCEREKGYEEEAPGPGD
jgi:hypothetical protein